MATDLSIDDLKRLGWATENTLAKILIDSNASLKVMQLLAQKFNIKESDVKKSVDQLNSAAKVTKKDSDKDREDRKTGRNNPTVKAVKDLQKSLYENFKSMFSGDHVHSMFGSFGQTLKYHSKYLEQSGEAALGLAKSLKFASIAILGFVGLTDILKQTNDIMQQVYGSGIEFDKGLTELAQAASDSGMTVSAFGGLISKYGAVAVTLGTKQTVGLSKQFQELTHYGGDLLMSQKDASDAFFDTVELMRSSQDLNSVGFTNLAAKGKVYLETLNELSIETGRNRDELRKQTQEILQNPLISLWSRSLPVEASDRLRETIARLNGEFGKTGDQLAVMLEQVRAGGGSFGLVSDEMKPLASFIPGFAEAMKNASIGVENGTITSEQAVKQLSDTIGNVSESTLLAMRRANPSLAGFISQLEAGRRQSDQARKEREKEIQQEMKDHNKTREQVLADRKDNEDRMKAISNAFNASGAAASRLKDSLALTASRLSGVIVPALNVLTSVVNGLSYVIDTVSGTLEPIGDAFKWIAGKINSLTGGTNAGEITVGIGALLGGSVIAVILSKVVKTLFGSMSSLLGRAIGGIVKGPMMVLGSIFKGLGSALAELGNPKALLGAGVLAGLSGSVFLLGAAFSEFGKVNWEDMAKAAVAITALTLASAAASVIAPEILIGGTAIAVALGAIGLALGGSALLLGNSLPKLAIGLKSFSDIDGSALIKTGIGIGAISVGLIALTASEITSGIGSLVTGFTSLFSADPISKLKRFAEIGEPLKLATESMKFLADVMPDAINTLANIKFTDDVVDTLDKLKSMFKTGWFSSGIKASDLNSGIFAIFQKFSEQKDIIQRAVDAINSLSNIDLTGFGKLRELLSMSTTMPGGLISNLADLLNTPRVMQGLQQAVQGNTSQTSQTASLPVSINTPPIITTDELNIKTVAYYEQTVKQFNQMIELMRATLSISDNTNDTNKKGFNDLANAVTQISGVIR